jgi:hypothetical protein
MFPCSFGDACRENGPATQQDPARLRFIPGAPRNFFGLQERCGCPPADRRYADPQLAVDGSNGMDGLQAVADALLRPWSVLDMRLAKMGKSKGGQRLAIDAEALWAFFCRAFAEATFGKTDDSLS